MWVYGNAKSLISHHRLRWKIERTLSPEKMCFSCILYDHSTLHGFLSLLKCRFGSRNVIHTRILSQDPSACVWDRSLARTGAICRSDQSTESGWGGERASRG